uniref:Uncharacterized protein n=1 Tax=mine drainage metagenome TaxID=410659 RepID=E6QHL1_9ZZZZ
MPSGALEQNLFHFMVGVEKVEGTGARTEALFDGLEQSFQDGCAKRIEEKGQTRGFGEDEFRGVATLDADGCQGEASRLPEVAIFAGNVSETGMQFDGDDLAKRQASGEQRGASHASAEVDEGVFPERSGTVQRPPAVAQALEDGRGNAVVGGAVAVVGMAGFEMAAVDEAAGFDLVFEVEGVTEIAVLDAEAGEFGFLSHDEGFPVPGRWAGGESFVRAGQP